MLKVNRPHQEPVRETHTHIKTQFFSQLRVLVYLCTCVLVPQWDFKFHILSTFHGGTFLCVIVCISVYLYLVDGKSNGVKVSTEASLPASVFLHQTNQDGAAILAVVRLVVDVLQADEELKVGAERGCRGTQGQSVFIYRASVSNIKATFKASHWCS